MHAAHTSVIVSQIAVGLLPVALREGGPDEMEAEPELVRLLRPAWARVSACCLDESRVMCRPCVW